jgi:hypothetical protein
MRTKIIQKGPLIFLRFFRVYNRHYAKSLVTARRDFFTIMIDSLALINRRARGGDAEDSLSLIERMNNGL